jgi:hypothetical protein
LAIGLDPENACSDLIIDANLAADDSALRLPTAASTVASSNAALP